MGLLNWLKSIFSSDDDFSPLVKNELQYILSLDISFMQLIRKLKFIFLIFTCTNLLSQTTINVDYLIVAGGGGGASGGGGAGGVLQGVDHAIPINTFITVVVGGGGSGGKGGARQGFVNGGNGQNSVFDSFT